MKRVLFCLGALISITHSSWSMEWSGSKKGYTEIPSPKDERNPYCYTDSCAGDTQDDAQTLDNLRSLQSTLLIEASLSTKDAPTTTIAHATKLYDISNVTHGSPDDMGSSAPTATHDGNIQAPKIVIQKVALSNQLAIVHYLVGNETSTRTASIPVNRTTKTTLSTGLLVTISAFLASSDPNATRK